MLTEKSNKMPVDLTAEAFIAELSKYQSDIELEKIKRYFKEKDNDEFIGVKMGIIFELAKIFIGMSIAEIKKLLESSVHEVRVGAVSIMDFQARNKKTSTFRRKELFDLYINRHDRINNWDLVDRSAPYVIGRYLFDKPRDILYDLAVSENQWERRTAIVSTYYFIRQSQLNDTFKIAEILVNDTEDLMHKAAGAWLREAGKKDIKRLIAFLDRYAPSMPRMMLRNAIEHFDKADREYYLGLKKNG